MKRLVIGILAHVDSGKTTLSEGMLYLSGCIKKLGRVDHGDAFLDSYELERERGITIFSKQAVLNFENSQFTLLDTPGHIDFSPEMERALQVIDYAILVISGTDGVQSHTETLWNLLCKHHVPTFIFVNKMDIHGADRTALISELKQRLSDSCVDFCEADKPDILQENLAMCDEKLLSQFLEAGFISDDLISSAISRRKIFPCYFGSALKLKGISELLIGLEKYTKMPPYNNNNNKFGAKIFKIARDNQDNRLTYLKITAGSLKVKAMLSQKTKSGEIISEKVNQLRVYSGAKFQAVDEAFPGMICAIPGLTHTHPGDGLGSESSSAVPILEPVLTYKVDFPFEYDIHVVITSLRILEEEEPELHVLWNEALQEIHVLLMGKVQMEIIERIMLERFKLNVRFTNGSILYKETIADTVEGIGHFEPLRHYSEVHLLLKSGEAGSGLCFDSTCSEDILDKNWQRLILTHLEEKVHLGVLTGSAITDMKITLVSGRASVKHTEGGDFRQATYRAVRQGLKKAKSVLLEPYYSFRLEVTAETVGRAMSDLQRMNAEFAPPEILGSTATLSGTMPVACVNDYQIEVTNYTHGKGRLSCTFSGYAPCHNQEEVVATIKYDSDSDLENTADSVFCSHGVGFIVKWDKVQDYMHLESALNTKPILQNLPNTEFIKKRAAVYCATLEQDKELLSIYERTYGPIKRDSRSSFRSVKEKKFKEKEKEKIPDIKLEPVTGPEYLLVDGYNIIFAWEELSAMARESLDTARNQLINILCNYQGFCRCELILVFDAYKVKGNLGDVEKVHNISVVYTKEAETADMYIEKVTHKLAKNHRVRVATSDGLEQLIIMSHGALRLPALAFREEVKQVENAIQDFLLRQ